MQLSIAERIAKISNEWPGTGWVAGELERINILRPLVEIIENVLGDMKEFIVNLITVLLVNIDNAAKPLISEIVSYANTILNSSLGQLVRDIDDMNTFIPTSFLNTQIFEIFGKVRLSIDRVINKASSIEQLFITTGRRLISHFDATMNNFALSIMGHIMDISNEVVRDFSQSVSVLKIRFAQLSADKTVLNSAILSFENRVIETVTSAKNAIPRIETQVVDFSDIAKGRIRSAITKGSAEAIQIGSQIEDSLITGIMIAFLSGCIYLIFVLTRMIR